MCVYGMLPLEDAHAGVLTLKKIACNTLAKEKVYSYLSRPTYSELTKTHDVLASIPEDLLADVTLTQSKNISLTQLDSYKNITGLVVCSDLNKVVLTSSDGSLITIDVITDEIHQNIISFNTIHPIYTNNDESCDESTDSLNFFEKTILSHRDTSSDYAFTSDDELDQYGSNNTEVVHDFGSYICTALSSDGSVWGATSSAHNDILLIGDIDFLSSEMEAGDYAKINKQISMAEELGVHYGDLKGLVLKPGGLQCAVVWEPLSSRFNDTQKLLFWQEDGSVKETIEMPRVQGLVYAHNEPLLAVSHEQGTVSLWDTETATRLSEFKFFEQEELITATGLSHDDKIIYVANVASELCAFNRDTRKNNRRNASNKGMVQIIQSHPQGLCVATATYNGEKGEVILWNKDITKKLWTFPCYVTALNFSQDGTFLYLVTGDKQLHRIPLGNPYELLCLRAWTTCKNEPEQRKAFKNWGIYKQVIAQEQKDNGILGEQLRNYLAMHTD